MPETVLGMPLIELLKAAGGLAKDLTLTSFMLWVLFLMMTGRIVRREELTTAVKNAQDAIAKAEGKETWWQEKFFATEQGTKEVLLAQGATIAALKGTIEAMAERLRSTPGA